MPSRDESLRQILDAHGGTFSLPPLSNEPTWIDQLRKRLLEWVDALLKQVSFDKQWEHTMGLLLKGLGIALAAIVLFGIYRLLRGVLGERTQVLEPEARTKAGMSGEERLLSALTRAEKEGRLALAARLRWKLFLLGEAKPGSTTPREYFGKGRHEAVMFGGISNTEEYAALTRDLAKEKGKHA